VLAIRVLGPLVAYYEGTPLPVDRGRRLPAVLGWLALHPGPQLRMKLATTLWPDVTDACARNNLRQVVWDLRRVLDHGAAQLGGDRDHVGFLVGPELWIDASAFDALVAAERLADAIGLVRGDLLDGLDDEWIDEERARWRRKLNQTLSRHGDRLEVEGALDGAVAVSRRLCELEPFDEVAQRALLRRLHATGRRAEAIASYEEFATRMRDDLGVPPERDTVDLVDRIRESSGARTRARMPHHAALELLTAVDTPFVGREKELDHLLGVWQRTLGHGQHIVGVDGEAGIGKTRLAAELASRVAASGGAVLVGRSTEDQLVPYQAWIEALRHRTLTKDPYSLRTELPDTAHTLLPLIPELAPLLGGRRGNETTTSVPADRYRMFQAVVDWLHGIAAGTPTMLFLDDLHHADPASLELLRFLARAPAIVRMLIVFTCRPRDREASEQYIGTLAELSRRGVTWLHLEGLTVDAVIALVTKSTASPPSEHFAETLHVRTGGNPFFVSEILRNLAGSGALHIRNSTWIWDLSNADIMIPEGVHQVLDRRLSRLDPVARRLLEVGAVAGADFDDVLLTAVTGVAGDTLLDALDATVSARLLAEHAGPGRYSFAHPLIRDVVYSDLTVTRRARLHERLGEALTACGAPAMSIARHLLQAGSPDALGRAIPLALEAAVNALDQGAYEDVVALLDLVLAIDHPALAPHRRRVLSLRGLALSAHPSRTFGLGTRVGGHSD
jgi:DNA-binding SARP family transcriptional activator